jgi:hypothetical protein
MNLRIEEVGDRAGSTDVGGVLMRFSQMLIDAVMMNPNA